MRVYTVVIFLLAAAFAALFDEDSIEEFNAYKEKYNKVYNNKEENIRHMEAYFAAKKRIEEHNRKFERGESSFTMGINKFSDMLHEDFVPASQKNKFVFESISEEYLDADDNEKLPDYVNWVERGAISPYKNLWGCDAKYAFAAVEGVQAHLFIKTKNLTLLSIQQILDCSNDYRCNGFSNALYSLVYLTNVEGIESERSYPYTAEPDACKYDKKKVVTPVRAVGVVRPKKELALKKALAKIGPINVQLCDAESLLSYSGGIFYSDDCHLPFLNLPALLVGYGTDKNTNEDYWLLKNYLGEDWGENGYLRLARNRDINCNITDLAVYPII